MFGAITALMLTHYLDARGCIVILTEWLSITKIEYPIAVTDAEVLIFFL